MARRKPGGADGAGGGIATAAVDSVSSQMAILQQSMVQLQVGMGQLVETAVIHTELLRAVLEATTAEATPEKNLAALLEQIVVQLGEQASLLRAIKTSVNQLPADVATVVGEQVAALAEIG